MKLRLRSNTIRLRMLKGEVDRLAQGQPVTETLPTPSPFHFAVKPSEVTDLRVSYEGDTLTVEVPRQWATEWAASDEVGRSARTNNIDILIEKDWACTTPRTGENDSGTYPNPTALP